MKLSKRNVLSWLRICMEGTHGSPETAGLQLQMPEVAYCGQTGYPRQSCFVLRVNPLYTSKYEGKSGRG